MVSKPTQVLQAEVNRLRHENDALHDEVYQLRTFVQALQSLVNAEKKYQANEDLMPFLEEIVRQMLDLLEAPDGSLQLLDHHTGELEFVIVHGAARDLVGQRLRPKEGIAGWVASTGNPVIVRDVRTDPRFSGRMDEEMGFRTQSIAAAALTGNGRILGVLEALNKPGDQPFNDQDLALLSLFSRLSGEILATIEDEGRAQGLLAPPDYGLE